MASQVGTPPQRPLVFIIYQPSNLLWSFFDSDLLEALRPNRVNVFDVLESMDDTPIENMFKVIEESRIALVIFSSGYTKSTWLLGQLVRIKELVEEGKLVVIPIFYKLAIIEVKHLTGKFGDNLRDLAKGISADKLEKWKEALYFVSQKTGVVYASDDKKACVIKKIVEQVKMEITRISPKQIESSHDYFLSELQEDSSMDSSRSEDLKGVARELDGILLDTKTDRDPMEADIVQPEAKSTSDDNGLNLTKDDNFFGETNSHSTVVELPPNHQILRYGFLSHLVKIFESYKNTSQLGMIIGCLLLLFFCLQQIAFISTPLTGAIDKIVENVPKEMSSNSPMDGKVKPPNIQVFINFRGQQLRTNFVGHLVAALRGSGINVFIDNHEQRGEDLNILFKGIEDSGIAIVVFSSMYTESKWCLDELVKIQERVHLGLLKVLPIYHKVTPGNVKRLKGDFGDNFRDKEYMYASDEPKIKRWKEAIMFVSDKLALTFDEKSSVLESDFIDTIVKAVLKMLHANSTTESGQSSR